MVSKSVWGPCVWYLFHTLAYKAVPGNFAEIKADLIQFIQRICSNLPCPECTQHATEYMTKHARVLAQITTKDQLHYFLVDFHNVVNARKKSRRLPTKKPINYINAQRHRMWSSISSRYMANVPMAAI